MAQPARTSIDRLRIEAAIREVERAYDAAWQAGDVDGLLACLATDAVLINPYGEAVQGHTQIRHELGEVLRGSAGYQTHTSVIARVALVTEDVAVVDGEAVLEGAGDQPEFRHHFTDVLVRRENGWRVAHVRAYQHLERRPRADGTTSTAPATPDIAPQGTQGRA